MPEIEFLIDTESGKCQTEIKGIKGVACEKTARTLKQLMGSPSIDKKTKEYFVQTQSKQQIKK